MSASYYEQLALGWSPATKNSKPVILITSLFVVTLLALAVFMSMLKVPEKPREARQAIPERIANFLLEKKKVEPKKPPPKPLVKARPKPKPKPEVKKTVKKVQTKDPEKPLTKTEKKAREKAETSGLLALSSELSDLMDTDDISSMIGSKVKSGSADSTQVATTDQNLLIADAGKGSGGVSDSNHTTMTNGVTALENRKITRIEQTLVDASVSGKTKTKTKTKIKTDKSKKQTRNAGVRSEESITLVFDKNKGKLYTIYNRARRKDPGLKGKVILQITIAPSGNVVKVSVVSSELDNTKLEKGLIGRIKQFNFGAQNVEEITVTYPIEFLPS